MGITVKRSRGALLVALILTVVVGAGLAAPYFWQKFGYVEVRRVPEKHFPLVRVILRNRLTDEVLFCLHDDGDRRLFRGREGVAYEIFERFSGGDSGNVETITKNAFDDRIMISYLQVQAAEDGPAVVNPHGEYVICDESEREVFAREFDRDTLKGTPFGSTLPRDRYEGVETEDGREGLWTFWDAQGRVEFQYLYEKGKRKEARIAPPWWDDVQDKKR